RCCGRGSGGHVDDRCGLRRRAPLDRAAHQKRQHEEEQEDAGKRV
ncbi:MAG: hypothetical protein AVDCRST_MAG26-1342, partial [uncultured Chloroflexia bacterium]